MQAGREIKLRRGAVWACAGPMALGLVATIYILTNVYDYNGQLPFFTVFAIPVYYLTALLFLPPLTAWLTGLRLRRIDEASSLKQWRTIFVSALIMATCTQAVIGLSYAIYIAIQYEVLFGEISDRAAGLGMDPMARDTLPNAYKMFAIASGTMWIALTAPLCAVGTSIFHRVTKFPSDRTVF